MATHEEKLKQDVVVERKFDVPPLRFESNGREMLYVYPDTKHEAAGWLLYRHPDGQWVSLRRATDADIRAMSNAVSRGFHAGF